MAQLDRYNFHVLGWKYLTAKSLNDDDHVIPKDDFRKHEISTECWCNPQIDNDNPEYCWEHFPLDGRLDFEKGIRLPS